MYDISTRVNHDEMRHIASRHDLRDAKQLVELLNALWPATYIVRDRMSGEELAIESQLSGN